MNNDTTSQGKIRLIVADDERHIRTVMKMELGSLGCEIVGEAKNGEEAIALFREKKPDVLLLDIHMPLKTGEEALKDIISDFPDACVIMLTSFSDMEHIGNCISDGAANYIRKDVPIQHIGSIIRETWNKFKLEKHKETK